mmetsp:Transcript_21705/g.33430  ORF Transcript_21705/g.33430 Transcript_21705/m.33430 type:complete len:223 (-) Transcript_21705:498-1166(-)
MPTLLSPYFGDISKILLLNASREDGQQYGVNLCQASYSTLINMVQFSSSSNDAVIYEIMIEVLKTLERTVAPGISIEKASSIQDSLSGLVQVCLVNIGSMIEPSLAGNIIHVIIQMFTQADTVTENGLIAFSGLVVGCGDKIDITSIGPYIKHALQSDENACTKLACGIISDLSNSFGEKMAEYMNDFVDPLLAILSNSAIDRAVKPHALRAIGDFAFSCGS